MVIRVALLGRVSGQNQKNRATIETQVTVMEAYCSKHGYEVVGRYLDTNVQSIVPTEERPECGRLLRDAEAKRFDLVLVYAVDRLSRYRYISDTFLIRLKELGIAFDSATEDLNLASKEGRVLYAVKMAFAERERDTIEMRMRDGRLRVAGDTWQHTDGQFYSFWLGGCCPYGYRVIQIGKRSALVPNEDPLPGLDFGEAQVVRMIFTWATRDNLSLEKIADRLNAMAVPKHCIQTEGNGRGRKCNADHLWRYGGVSRIIRNDHHTGRCHYAGVEGRIPALISRETFQWAMRALQDRRTYADPNAHTHYLLRGKIYCGICGARAVGSPQYSRENGGRRRNGRHWYICGARHAQKRYGRSCITGYIEGVPIDEMVWAEVLHFVTHPGEALRRLKSQILGTVHERSDVQKEVDELRRLVDQKQMALKKLRRAYIDEVITEAEYLEDKADYERDLQDRHRHIQELEALQDDQTDMETHLRRAEEFLTSLNAETADTWSPEKKRRLVELLVDRVLVTSDNLEVRYYFAATGFVPSARRGSSTS